MSNTSSIHPDLDDWNADPSNALEWAKIWSQPVMQFGLRVLINNGLPLPRIVPGVDLIQLHALRAATESGYYDFARSIERLKSPPLPKPEMKSGKGWAEADLLNPPPEITTPPADVQ
jgi:hypothetical protein